MSYKTIKNFLPQEQFEKLKNLICNPDNNFPWYYKNISEVDKGFFTHYFYVDNKIYCNYFNDYVEPILKQLEVKALIEARVHMFISEFFKNKPSEWHIHYPFKAKTSILYLNTCDSGTELKINDEEIFIKQEANTMLIFDSDIYHRGTPSTEDDIRYLINFSYF